MDNICSEAASCQHLGVGIEQIDETYFSFINIDTKSNKVSWSEPYNIKDMFCEAFIKRNMERYLYPHLESSQHRVLAYIVDRTISWKKVNEKIRKSHFYKGIYGYSNGTGLSRPAIDKALKWLSDNGFIDVKDHRYSVNFNKIHEWTIENKVGLQLKDKQYRTSGNKSKMSLHSKSEKCNPILHNNRKKPSYNSEKVSVDPKDPLTTSKGLDENITKEEYSSLQAVNKNERNGPQPLEFFTTSTELNKWWKMMVKKKYPNAVQVKWTKRDFAMVKQLIKAVELPCNTTLYEFFEFVVEKWFAIKDLHFSFINAGIKRKDGDIIKYPEYPDITFTMVYKKNFLNAFQRDRLDQLSPDYWYRKRKLREGYTHQQVDEAVTARLVNKESNDKAEEGIKLREESLRYKELEVKRKVDNFRRYSGNVRNNLTMELGKLFNQSRPQVVEGNSSIKYNYTEPKEEAPLPDEEVLRELANRWAEGREWPDADYIFQCFKMHGIEWTRTALCIDAESG
jgi:hypothetical protein